jgi:hypothetical protein
VDVGCPSVVVAYRGKRADQMQAAVHRQES